MTDEPSGFFFKGKPWAQLQEGAQTDTDRADQLKFGFTSRLHLHNKGVLDIMSFILIDLLC